MSIKQKCVCGCGGNEGVEMDEWSHQAGQN